MHALIKQFITLLPIKVYYQGEQINRSILLNRATAFNCLYRSNEQGETSLLASKH